MTMKATIEKIVKIRPTPYGFIGKDDTGIINKTVVIKLFTIPIYKKEILVQKNYLTAPES